MISQTETTGGAGQYGFYAVPKAVEPKKKYRDNIQDEEEEEQVEDLNPYATIDDRAALNQRELERDYYVDEAPYPEFKPKERGLDYGVQIERGDLFDFDLQVKPLVQILVGRSVVSAINQLQQQKEKEERRQNLDKYQKKRNAELMVTQRLQAKHKRKLEEADRRKLQKDVYVKNQKEAGKKLIARRNAKQSLLGFKNDLFNELEDGGYLRAEPTSDLKIKYEQWLYEKIMEALKFKAETEAVAQNMIREEEKIIAAEHQKAISQEMAKRKIILDQRERIQKENQERKEKKRARKLRHKLNNQREPDFIRFQQLMQRYEHVQSILKFGERSNGFSRNYAGRQSVYIAGGLCNYFLALLSSSGREFTAEQIQVLIMKIINESGKQFEVELLSHHYDKVEEVAKKMQQDKGDFMKQKVGQIKKLVEQIALDLSLLEAAGSPLKSALHKNFIEALLSIYLTAQPQKTEENQVELSDVDKKRLQFAHKIVLSKQQQSFVQRIQNVNEILRVRFQILHEALHSEASEKKEEESHEAQKEEQEWIDTYDGEGWKRYAKLAKRELNRGEQTAAAIGLGTFQNTFVFDERVCHYLETQMQKLLQVNGGEKLKQYCESLCNIRAHLKKDLPVYDSEIRWG